MEGHHRAVVQHRPSSLTNESLLHPTEWSVNLCMSLMNIYVRNELNLIIPHTDVIQSLIVWHEKVSRLDDDLG